MQSPTQDLSNRLLFSITGLAGVAGLVAAVVFGASAADWARPGSPLLQSLAIAGSVMLVGSFIAVMAKRFGQPGKRGFRKHVVLASLGLALVLAHWSFQVLQFPTFLIVLLAGWWLSAFGPVAGAQRLWRERSGGSMGAFAAPSPVTRERLKALIGEKRTLLERIDPQESEATFSLQPRHWLSRPMQARAYQALCAEELKLTGAAAAFTRGQRYWRLAHRLLAWGFVGGLLLHIIIVLFFAGYVADGGEIYWWHVTDWDF